MAARWAAACDPANRSSGSVPTAAAHSRPCCCRSQCGHLPDSGSALASVPACIEQPRPMGSWPAPCLASSQRASMPPVSALPPPVRRLWRTCLHLLHGSAVGGLCHRQHPMPSWHTPDGYGEPTSRCAASRPMQWLPGALSFAADADIPLRPPQAGHGAPAAHLQQSGAVCGDQPDARAPGECPRQ